ncbi:TonB-dependent receptor [Derxia gummosa]|uniref:TonB-dependent receptor n=1 Tax=Derxia gummosa DSM 723 TaxID=1121388 RepID=A0A8B6X9L2_9BURK|nr:TonB-dependent receptor [Derxia gummosa]
MNPYSTLRPTATGAARRFRLSPIALAAASLAVLACNPLQAAEDDKKPDADAAEAPALGAVTVRSRNRIEKLQDVPLSISVVQGQELERLGAYGIDAITKRAANVSWNQGNQRTSSLSIRGLGKIGQTEAQDPSVGVIVDGVNFAYNALTSSFDFVDVDAVEVTRGPQGTLLGKNTSVGVINITTRRPSFTPSTDYAIQFSQRQGLFATAAVGGPVVEDLLAWRGTFSANRQQGDMTNAYNRDITYTNTDRISGRVQFLLTPTPDFNARFAFELQPRAGETTNRRERYTPTPATYANGSPNNAVDNGTRLARRWFTQNSGYTLDDYYAGINNDNQRPIVTGSRGTSAELNWKLGEGHTLTSITAYKDYHFNAVNDEGTPFDVMRNSGGFWNDYRQLSQELRISSRTGGLVDYQAGVFLMDVKNVANYQRSWGNDAGAWWASNGQYNRLDADGAGRALMAASLANLNMYYNSPAGSQNIRNKNAAIFAQANWHLSEPLTLTTGLRFTRENRSNENSSYILSNGSAPELNPSVVNGVALGGFDSYYNTGNSTRWVLNGNVVPAGTPGAVQVGAGQVALTTDSTNAAASAAALAQANAAAQRYFNVATWAALSDAQKRQLADAQAIRKSQIGVVFNRVEAKTYNSTQPALVISPSWKLDRDLTAYASYQHGEKAGISQVVNGISSPVKAEKTDSYELGLKSVLLDRTLVLNADVFLMNIKDYQQAVRVLDAYTTTLNNDGTNYWTSATGNVPKVQVKGLEFDGVYAGIPRTQLRFSGAWNRAVYKSFTNSAQPVENGWTGAPAYRDVSGQRIAGAPLFSANVGIDYRQPAFGDHEFHTSANAAYTSSYNSDVSLSSYAVIPSNWLVDAAVGLGARNKSFDVSVVVKNLLNDDTPRSKTWNSYVPAVPRTVGILFTSKL